MTATPSTVVNLNVLNPEHATKFCEALAKRTTNEFAKTWLTTTLRKWLLKKPKLHKILADENELSSFWYRSLKASSSPTRLKDLQAVEDSTHFVDPDTLPDWAQDAFKKNKLFWFQPTENHKERFAHLTDFLEGYATKPMVDTPEVIIEKVKAWDKYLENQKVIGSMAEGVETQPPLKGHPEYFMVRLDAPIAYKVEGALMKHCVAGYANRRSLIYSLRKLDQPYPAATIEVKTTTGTVVQIKARFNKEPPKEELDIIYGWAKAQGLTIDLNFFDDDEEEDVDEDEDNDDEEDEEDDEEDDDEDYKASLDDDNLI